MGAISSYKKQFVTAAKKLTSDEMQLLEVNQEIEALQKRKKELETKVENDRQNKCQTGVLYYSESRRNCLLSKAKELRYPEETLTRLRSINEDQWNPSYVENDTIDDFEAIEKYVKEKTPAWEKSPVAKFGKWINGSKQE